MKKLLVALSFSAFFSASSSNAAPPCDFKGLSVGDKMTPAQAMNALGVVKYKTKPTLPSFEEEMQNTQKYGLIASGELRDWKIGPYCDDASCVIPYGVSVGNNNIPVSVYFSVRGGLVTEIDVSFGETFWDEIVPILDNKYGALWSVEKSALLITDYETKKNSLQDRVTLTHKLSGTNAKTNDKCQIWATNFDLVFTHHDPLGAYHSQLVIKLVSKNF